MCLFFSKTICPYVDIFFFSTKDLKMVIFKQLQHSGIQKSPQRPQEVELIKDVEEWSIPGGLATETTRKEN